MMDRTRTAALVVLAAVALLAAACGDDSGLTEATDDGSAVTTTAPGGSTDDGGTTVGAITVTGAALPLFESVPDPAVGMAAPEVTGPGFDGSDMAFVNGEPRVIVFLAHWCGHCQDEVTDLMTWLNAGNDLPDGVAVQSISTRAAADAPNYPPDAWLATEGWPYPVMVDDDAETLGATFGLGGTPLWVAIDSSGTVVARVSGTQGPDEIVALMNLTLSA